MTSPALLVLFLAHACSILSTASDPGADHDYIPTNMVTHKQNKWTSRYKIYNYNINNVNNIEDDIYTDSDDIQANTFDFVQRSKDENEREYPLVQNTIVGNTKETLSYTEKQNVNMITNNLRLPDKRIRNTPHLPYTPYSKQTLDRKENRRIINSPVRFFNSLSIYNNLDDEGEQIVSKRDITISNARKDTKSVSKLNFHKEEKALTTLQNKRGNEETRRVKRDVDPCASFQFDSTKDYITHPYIESSALYSNNTDCTTVIRVPDGYVIELTFVDKFRIEYHPECTYDYLEIRDGDHGYSDLLGHVCGQAFPRVMKTKGPYAWLKFHSDDTIEYEGFKIKITQLVDAASYSIPKECYVELEEAYYGTIRSKDIDDKCKAGTATHGVDVLWTINTPEKTKIFLNFTEYELEDPNECDKNGIQVFGAVLELSAKLEYYCGSVANPVISKGDKPDDVGNIMHIRLYTSKAYTQDTKFVAKYTAFRTINPAVDSDICAEDEFDCADNTCIQGDLKCNLYADCRLKTDEDMDTCKNEAGSPIKQTHILVILIIFTLILSGMMFVFLFKCIRKLYQDHKIIKEHIRQSCEDRLDRLDSLVENRLTLDAKRLQRDSEPRASLERENHTNEMFKRKRDSFSKRQPTSIDSDFQETQLDIDEETWRRDTHPHIEPEDILIERSDSKHRRNTKKESLRSRRESEERRDKSVGAPDTKESGCQTRESLFQTDPPPSSDGKSSSSNSRGFSTFGYSGATIVRPSPPAQTSEITIELLKQVPRQDSVKPQKKIDRRPMSAETTRSAPDVIIVSKPIR